MSLGQTPQDTAQPLTPPGADDPDEGSEKYDIQFKIIVVGSTQVGKTAILTRFCDKEFREASISTIGVDFRTQVTERSGKAVRLVLWDTAGQERFRTLVSSFYRGAEGIFVVYDVSSKDTFDDVPLWMAEIGKYCSSGVACLIVGNKIDLPDREVSREEGESLAKDLGMEYFEISAKTGAGVNEAFDRLTAMMMENPAILEQMRREADYCDYVKPTGDDDDSENPDPTADGNSNGSKSSKHRPRFKC